MKNKDFHKLLAVYIENTGMDALTGDELVLLALVAEEKGLHSLKSQKLAGKLFDCLEHLKHPKVFTAIVALIIAVSVELSNVSKTNYIVDLCGTHPHARFIEETLVQLINKPPPGQIIKYLTFAIDLFQQPVIRDKFYYLNDVIVLLEALLRDMDSSIKPEIRLKYLELIKLIVEWPAYIEKNDRWKDVLEALNDMASNKDLDKPTKDACQKIIDSMNEINPPIVEAPPAEEKKGSEANSNSPKEENKVIPNSQVEEKKEKATLPNPPTEEKKAGINEIPLSSPVEQKENVAIPVNNLVEQPPANEIPNNQATGQYPETTASVEQYANAEIPAYQYAEPYTEAPAEQYASNEVPAHNPPEQYVINEVPAYIPPEQYPNNEIPAYNYTEQYANTEAATNIQAEQYQYSEVQAYPPAEQYATNAVPTDPQNQYSEAQAYPQTDQYTYPTAEQYPSTEVPAEQYSAPSTVPEVKAETNTNTQPVNENPNTT